MKANRFLSTVMRFGVLAAIFVWLSGVSLAQTMPLSPGANTQFGRLSWYPSLTNFDGSFSGQLAFGVYGQANNNTTMANPNGHGNYGFGLFGYTGANGLFGGAAHSVVTGVARNVGFWALAANAGAGTNLAHTPADTGIAGVAIGLEVGAGGGAGTTNGHVGLAIQVDSGDVQLAAGTNTTSVYNLTVYGAFNGPSNNFYTQTTTGAAVTSLPGTTAVVSADITGTANTDNNFSSTNASNSTGGSLYFGNATGTGANLLKLQTAGTTNFLVKNSGDLSIGADKFTVTAATGATNAEGDLTVGLTGVPYFQVAAANGTLSIGPLVDKFQVDGATGTIAVAGAGTLAAPHFKVAGATGDVTVLDNLTASGNIASITAGLGTISTGSQNGLYVTQSGNTGFGIDVTRAVGGVNGFGIKMTVPGAAGPTTGAALRVTRGADIDTLNISSQLQFNSGTTADFTGATIIGMSGNNEFKQDADASNVVISSTKNEGLHVSMGDPNGVNTHPALLLEQFTGATATGMLIEAKKGANDVFTVGNTGDLDIGVGATKNFSVAAASGNTNAAGNVTVGAATAAAATAEIYKDGTIEVVGNGSLGSASFTVAGANGQTSVTTTTTGVTLTLQENNVTGQALVVGGTKSVGYVTALQKDPSTGTLANIFTIPTGTATPGTGGVAGGSAALSVFRGAIIDTLDVSGKLQFGTTLSKAYVDFTNAIVTGLTDTNAVAFHKGSAQINGSTDPAIWILQSAPPGGSNDFMKLQINGPTTVFDINKDGDLTISPTTGTALTVTGSAASPGVSVTGAAGQDGGDFTTSGAGSGISVTNTTAGKTAIMINGGVTVANTGSQPSGSVAAQIAIGTRTKTVTVTNALAQLTSNIICSVTSTAGDSYTATVVARTAGTFDVKVTCVEGDVPAAEDTTISYWIVNVAP